jgi:hypothetical protein
VASGVAIIGAVFYGGLGGIPARGTFVSAMELAMTCAAVLLVVAAAVTLLLPRRAGSRRTDQGPQAAIAARASGAE